MARANRPPTEAPSKEPAEGSRRAVDEALRRSPGQTRPDRRPRPREKAQTDVPPDRHALDD